MAPPLAPLAEAPKTVRKAMLRGSIHTHTSGIGYGAWRDGPPSERFPTWRSESDNVKPDFGHSTSWQHKNPEQRATQAAKLLVSGEIGNWVRDDFVAPTREKYKFIDRTWGAPTTSRACPSRQRTQRSQSHKALLSSRVNSPVADLVRPRNSELSLDAGRLDASFPRSCKRDLAFAAKPDEFRSTLPFQRTSGHAALAHSELASSLSRHWTHALRGQGY